MARTAPTRTCSPRSSSSWRWPSPPTGPTSRSCGGCCAGTSSRSTEPRRPPELMRASGARAVRGVISGLLYFYPLLLLLIVWEAVAAAGLVRPIFLPRVSAVLVQSVRLVEDGQIFGLVLTSLYRAFAGLVLAVAAGVALGVAMTRVR